MITKGLELLELEKARLVKKLEDDQATMEHYRGVFERMSENLIEVRESLEQIEASLKKLKEQ